MMLSRLDVLVTIDLSKVALFDESVPWEKFLADRPDVVKDVQAGLTEDVVELPQGYF